MYVTSSSARLVRKSYDPCARCETHFITSYVCQPPSTS